MKFLKQLFNKNQNVEVIDFNSFWQWFLLHQNDFFTVVKEHKNVEEDFFNHLAAKLEPLQYEFYFLTGMFNDDCAELIISAEGHIKNFVFAEELIALAPTLPNWKFTALKPAMEDGLSIEAYDLSFSTDNLFFYENQQEVFPDEIDITIVHDDATEDNLQNIINGTYIFLDNFLGELDFADKIDKLEVIEKNKAQKELIPINKIKAFLNWREKEFVEKYDDIRYNTEDDEHTIYELNLDDDNNAVAIINTELLKWDSKSSHPWFLTILVEINEEQEKENVIEITDEMQGKILDQLKDSDGYLFVGRETSDTYREVYFACKEFRNASKVVANILKEYEGKLDVTYEIIKDKYWQSLQRFYQ